MGVLHTHQLCEFQSPNKPRQVPFSFDKALLNVLLTFSILLLVPLTTFSNTIIEVEGGNILLDGISQVSCDNATNGGEIAADEFGCPNPVWDPSLITNVTLPSGGTGTLEYIWIFTTDDPASPGAFWNPIPGSNSPEYDPGPISVTTYYRRCARRSGCTDYIAESNIVVKEAICCDNVTDGGMIAANQVLCDPSSPANALTNVVFPSGGNAQPIEYQWVMSTSGTPYTPANPDWVPIPGADSPGYDPGTLSQTTYFIRLSRRHGCYDYDGVSNTIEIYINDGIMPETAGQPVTCVGASDGEASVTNVTGGSPGYSYQWTGFPGATNAVLNGLLPGDYTVVITDARGCTGSATATVEDAVPLDLTTSSTQATCDDSADGTATVSVSGGVGPYTYVWNDPAAQTTATAVNLLMGDYNVVVTDANGCTATASENVGAPMKAVLVFTTTDVACFGGSDGNAEVGIENGNIADYNVLWSTGAVTPVIGNLPAGDYSVTVSDINGCSVEGNVSLSEPSPILLTMDADSASCFGSSDGTAIVMASGGTPFPNNVYQYVWDAPGSPAVPMLDDVSPGFYTATVTDANGCTASAGIEIGAPDEIQISFQATHVSCNGLTDGSATATVTGGTPPYNYQWNDSSNSTSSSLSNLAPGAYTLSVTDAHSCLATAILNITEPAPLTLEFNNVNVVCTDDTDGVALVVPAGGTPPYSFLWESGQMTQAVFNLGVGTYNVTVADNNGCEVTGTAQIEATTTLSSTITVFDATCFDLDNGVAIASGFNGTPPYTYNWSNGQTTSQINGLYFGSYTVTVTDADGCSVTNTAVVNSPPLLQGAVQVLSQVLTYGGTEGSAEVTATGGVPPYSYLWSNGANSATVSGLEGGVHSVTITDANFCTTVETVELAEPSKIGNYVWNDENQNGIQDVTEGGIEGINVQLTGVTAQGDSIDLTTSTDTSGFYAFDGLTEGIYKLSFETPANHVVTYQNVGSDLLDSDPDPNTGETQNFHLSQGEYEDQWDCGLIVLDEKTDIGDKVWYDVDHNGIQGLNEAGVEGIVVRLRELPANTIVAMDVTDLLGNYLFEDVLPGTYTIEFSLASLPPGGYIVSPKDQGSDDAKDSDANIATGITDPFDVFPFMLDNLTIDMGIFKECDNVTDGGLIGYDEDLCGVGADPAEIVNIALPSGGYGNLEYVWLKSNIPIYNGPGDPNWSMIPNSNSPNYDPGPIGQSTYYIRCARREGCDDYIGESNVVAKEITPLPLAQIVDKPGLLCKNEEGRFEAAIAGAGATYYWEFDGGGNPLNADTRVVDPVSWPTPGVKNVTLTVTRFGCSFSTTTQVIIDNCGTNPLITFDDLFAEVQGQSIEVKWKVKGNTDATVFYVQSSENGQAFRTIGQVMGQPGQEQSEYFFMDRQPKFGENIYRIKYEKLTGGHESGYSMTSKAMFKREPTQLAQIFPNPTTGQVTIELLLPNDQPSHGEVVTPYGKSIRSFEIPPNTEKYQLDLGAEFDGLYLVKIINPQFREQVCKVFKAK